MPDSVKLELDIRAVSRNIRRLADKDVNRAMARAINATSFDIIDAEKLHVSQVFEFAGPQTAQFLSGKGSFAFKGANATRLESRIFPRAKTEKALGDHQRGATVTAQLGNRLALGGRLAVPIGEVRIRTQRGRVPKRLLPGSLLAEGGRGFIAGSTIFERKGGRRRGAKRAAGGPGRVRALYALVITVKLRPVFDFYRVARDTAKRQFPIKAKRAFEKIKVPRR